jgi:hypothetical protein
MKLSHRRDAGNIKTQYKPANPGNILAYLHQHTLLRSGFACMSVINIEALANIQVGR